nr:ATP-binding protein [Numidum massiliense]
MWRSVVGKLWMTIIGLVSVVLLILVGLLMQFLDQFYQQQQEHELTRLSRDVSDMIESYGKTDSLESRHHVLEMAQQLLPAYETHMVVLTKEDGKIKQMPFLKHTDYPTIPLETLLDRKNFDIEKVFAGEEQKLRGPLNVKENGHDESIPHLTIAEPIHGTTGVIGALVLYQPLSQLEETMQRTKELVFYAALIGIFMTTIFAFFLSSRVSQPLMQMKQAADKVAKGNFNYRIPIRTNDEIGDLAQTFNRMGSKLEETIHALSQEKEQLSSVLKSMADAVITADAKGQVIITNPPAQHLLETWSSDHKEETHKLLPNAPLPEPLAETFNQVVRGEKEYMTDIVVHGRTWAVVMAPLYAGEQLRGVVAVLRDVTEERRTDKLRKDFVANVSHELRTPLAMLQGYSEALLDEIAQSPEDRKELTQIIHDESLRMGRLVKELLDLALMEAGTVRIQPHEMTAQELVLRVVRKFQGLAQEKGLTVEAKVTEEPLRVRLDEDSIEQVCINLIENAIRHTPEGGTITLSVDPSKEGVVFKVRDTGSGIPEQDLPFVFERFYKADKARTRSRSGTGLGLSIAKHIVEAHGGTISVESTVGEGTTFTLRIPNVSEGE